MTKRLIANVLRRPNSMHVNVLVFSPFLHLFADCTFTVCDILASSSLELQWEQSMCNRCLVSLPSLKEMRHQWFVLRSLEKCFMGAHIDPIDSPCGRNVVAACGGVFALISVRRHIGLTIFNL